MLKKEHSHIDRKIKAKLKQKDIDEADREWVQLCLNYDYKDNNDIQDLEPGVQ